MSLFGVSPNAGGQPPRRYHGQDPHGHRNRWRGGAKRLLELKWWEYDMGQVSNRVDYSKPEEVIDFMNRGISEGRIAKLTFPRIRIVPRIRIEKSLRAINRKR